MVRTFVAVDLPDDVGRALGEAARILREARIEGLRPVRPEGVHLTLKFLGDVPGSRLGEGGGGGLGRGRGPSPVRRFHRLIRRIPAHPQAAGALGGHRGRRGAVAAPPGGRRRVSRRAGLPGRDEAVPPSPYPCPPGPRYARPRETCGPGRPRIDRAARRDAYPGPLRVPHREQTRPRGRQVHAPCHGTCNRLVGQVLVGAIPCGCPLLHRVWGDHKGRALRIGRG